MMGPSDGPASGASNNPFDNVCRWSLGGPFVSWYLARAAPAGENRTTIRHYRTGCKEFVGYVYFDFGTV